MESFVTKIVKNGFSFLAKGGANQYHGEPFWDAVKNDRWEKETFAIIHKYCSPDRTFIDIGAWIGPTTLFGACVAQRVYAVEPDPVALRSLKDNIALNHGFQDKIVLYEGCISSTTGKVVVGNRKAFGNSETSMLFCRADQHMTVNSLTFCDFVNAHQITNCCLIKIDVEGAELIILPGMIDFLSRHKPALLLSIHKPFYEDRGDQIVSVMFDILRQIYRNIYTTDGRKIVDIRSIKEPLFDIVACDSVW